MKGLDYIKKKYHENDVCMRSLLANIGCSEIRGLTIEDAHALYEEACRWAGEEDE